VEAVGEPLKKPPKPSDLFNPLLIRIPEIKIKQLNYCKSIIKVK
jgi:hypothetical protein